MQSMGREELTFLIIRSESKSIRTSLPLARKTSPIRNGLTASQMHIRGISPSRVSNGIDLLDGDSLKGVASVTTIPTITIVGAQNENYFMV